MTNKIFIDYVNNKVTINDFEMLLTHFQTLEPNIVLPRYFTELYVSEDDNEEQYIEFEGVKSALFEHKVRGELLETVNKIDEYKEYQKKIAKIEKKAELEIAYNQVKDKFTLTFDYNGTQKTYKEYKLWELIELTNQKKSVMSDRKKLGEDTIANDAFTAENQFKFRIDGIEIPVTEEQLMKLNIELSAVLDAMYKKEQEILSEIEALNLAQNVIDYQISFDGVKTELNFNSI